MITIKKNEGREKRKGKFVMKALKGKENEIK